jgi:hypothetical protein
MNYRKLVIVIIRILSATSIALCALLIWSYGWRPDWATALTLFPAWAWLIFSPFLFSSVGQFHGKIGLGCWLAFAILHVEEPISFLRGFSSPPPTRGLRVATINCSGSISAIADALSESPDIVLIQDSPTLSEWGDFLKNHPGYEIVPGIDASILVKGSVQPHRQERFYTISMVNIRSLVFGVGSLRLATSDPRIDLWNPTCWRDQSTLRKKQLTQISQIQNQLPKSVPLILGGDFNVPQGDRVFATLKDQLRDSFDGAARGGCNTITTSFPLLRIDQIWTTQDLRSVNAYTKKSAHTDHRIYVADFELLAP